MELLVNPASYSNALELIELGVHQISVGDAKFSARNNCCLSLDEISVLASKKKITKLLVLVNRFYFDPELNELETYIISISKLDIDGIIFGDYAVAQICHEQNINVDLIYNPETLVTNYGQFEFYLQNKISEVAIAREVNGKNIQEIGQNKGKMRVQVQAAGYSFIMHSRWKLVSNFAKTQKINDNLTKTKLMIREISRTQPTIIYEDDFGTQVFTKYSLSLFDKLEELSKANVDTIRIDSFLHDATWTTNMAKIYLNGINAINNHTFNEMLIEKSIKDMGAELISRGFYNMDHKDLIYLVKDEGSYE